MAFFELNGWPLFIITVILAFLALAFTVVVLPRQRRPGILKYVMQFVGVALVSLLVLVGIFLKMNMDNQWYSSWGDLLSGGGGQVAVTDVGATAAAAKPIKDLPHRAFNAMQTNPTQNAFFGSQMDPNNTSGQW